MLNLRNHGVGFINFPTLAVLAVMLFSSRLGFSMQFVGCIVSALDERNNLTVTRVQMNSSYIYLTPSFTVTLKLE